MTKDNMNDISLGILLFLQYGKAKSPRSDSAAVISYFGQTHGIAILAHVHRIIQEAKSLKIDWSTHTLATAGEFVKDRVSSEYPELSADALNAIAWKVTFDLR